MVEVGRDTRDIAVEANSKINQHMTDCTKFREALAETVAEIRLDLKKLNWRMALIVGGLIISGKVVDYLVPHAAPQVTVTQVRHD